MKRSAFTFLVGVFLFVVEGTDGALAAMFYEGEVRRDDRVEELAQKVERKSLGTGEV